MARVRRIVTILASLSVAVVLSFVAARYGAASDTAPVRPLPPAAPAAVAAPALIPGAQVGTLGEADLMVWAVDASGATIEGTNPGTVCGQTWHDYASTPSAFLQAPLTLPAGATLLQLDVYGCMTGSGTQSWYLENEDTTGALSSFTPDFQTSSGPGLVHGGVSFNGGIFPNGWTLEAGHQFLVTLKQSSAASGFKGVVYQYRLPTLTLVPITPARVYDTRFSQFGGPIAVGASRLVSVRDAITVATGAVSVPNAIPQGARAVAYNLTIVSTVGAGNVAVVPGNSTSVTSSAINWYTAGQILANGGVIGLGSGTSERQLTLVVNGTPNSSTHVVLDITGYYK